MPKDGRTLAARKIQRGPLFERLDTPTEVRNIFVLPFQKAASLGCAKILETLTACRPVGVGAKE